MAGEIDLELFGKGIGQAVRETLDKRLAPILDRLEAMERSKGLNFRGVHNLGEIYRAGDVVTKAGSSFVATIDLPSEPPAHSDDRIGDGWALLARRGRDAKSENRR